MEEYKGYTGTVELHDDRIVIKREKWRQRAGGFDETREIPCAAISGVELKPAKWGMNGWLQLQLGGAPPRSTNGDPNAIAFTRKHSSV